MNNQATLLTSIRGTLTPLSFMCPDVSQSAFSGALYPTAYTGLAELGNYCCGDVDGPSRDFQCNPSVFLPVWLPKNKQQVIEQEHSDEGYWLVEHHKLVIGIAVVLLIVGRHWC